MKKSLIPQSLLIRNLKKSLKKKQRKGGLIMKFSSGVSVMDAIKKWDKGEILWSIEMGGLGPSYEQTIQIAVIEILRNAVSYNKILDAEEFQVIGRDTLSIHDQSLGGMSGAQAGASMQLAY